MFQVDKFSVPKPGTKARVDTGTEASDPGELQCTGSRPCQATRHAAWTSQAQW